MPTNERILHFFHNVIVTLDPTKNAIIDKPEHPAYALCKKKGDFILISPSTSPCSLQAPIL